MSDSSPFYVERKPMKNQGVFMGDGLPFRFAFSVWTGEKIPGGMVGDTSLYYCFQVGHGTSYETRVLPGKQDRCWIKKSVFEAVNTGSIFSGSENLRILKYKSGSIVIFYYGMVVGIIHGGPTSSEMLWNTHVSFVSGYVFDDATATYWQDRRTTHLASTRFEFTAPLYRGVLDLVNDRIVWIQREHQFVFDDIVDEETEYCLIPTGDIDRVVQRLHIGVPNLFSVIDQRIGVFNSISEDVKRPELRLVPEFLGGPGTSDILPTNVDVPPAQTYPLPQYKSFTLNDVTGIIDSGSLVNIFSYRNAAYYLNILDGIGEGNRLLLYITLAFDEDAETITGELSHIEGVSPAIPSAAEGTINLALCSVMYENNKYSISAINSYRHTITGGAIELQNPDSDVDNLSIERNSTNQLQIAGWETQDVGGGSVDLTQTNFVARSGKGGRLVYVDLSELMFEPDEVSIDKNTDDKFEINGWGSAASIDTPEDLTDLGFVCRDGTPEENTLKFVKLDDLKTDVEVDDVTIEKDTENDDVLQIKGFPSEDAVLLDINDKGIQDGNENETEWAFLTRVTDGETDPYLQYTKHIAARYFLKGDEDNSLGVVRGVTAAEDEEDDNPLVVRLAGVDAKPAATNPTGLQRVYGYSSAGHWGLFQLEALFKFDATNKRFYIDLAGYTNFKSLSTDAATWDFNADANLDGKNGVTFDVVTDVVWDSTNNKLVCKKRSVTLFKFGLKSIGAASSSDVIAGEECE